MTLQAEKGKILAQKNVFCIYSFLNLITTYSNIYKNKNYQNTKNKSFSHLELALTGGGKWDPIHAVEYIPSN